MVKHFRCKQATCQCQELHAPGKQTGRSMRTYTLILIRTLIGTCLIALCFAVLCSALLFSRFNNTRNHSYVLRYCCLLLHSRYAPLENFVAVQIAMENEKTVVQNKDGSCTKCWRTFMPALANLCLLALSSGVHERDNCKARHGMAQHGTARRARHRKAPHGVAPGR